MDPRLRIVPNAELPAMRGAEKIVTELVEITTERMAEAYVQGFKQGIVESLRIVKDSALFNIDPALDEKLQGLIEQMDGDGAEGGNT